MHQNKLHACLVRSKEVHLCNSGSLFQIVI